MPPDRAEAERLPPHNRDAERCVLGSVLRDNAVWDDVVQLLGNESFFYYDAHQKIFCAMRTLRDRNHPVDLVLLAEYLAAQKQIEDVGGYAYLAELWDAAPTAANAEYYTKIVREKGLVRGLIHACNEVLRDAYDAGQPAEELLGQAEKKIFQIAQTGVTGQTYTLEEVLQEAYDRIDRRQMHEQTSLTSVGTGFIDLDEKTAGLHNTQLVILAARPSVGKCLTADAEVVLDDGSLATMEELYRRKHARLLTLHDDWRLRWTEPSAFVDDGVKPVYRVQTRSGREIEATASHPFRTLKGWVPLAALAAGESVAVPRRVNVFGREAMRECEVKLLAYLIGDGCLRDGTPEFTNTNPRLRGEFTEAVREFGPLAVRECDSNGTRATTLHVSGDLALIAKERLEFAGRLKSAMEARPLTGRTVAGRTGSSAGAVTLWRQGRCVPDGDVFAKLCAVLGVSPQYLAPLGLSAIRRNSKNPLTTWLVDLGLWGKGSAGKFVPTAVFRLPRPQLALFLNRLFATDGWATVLAGGNPQIGYASVSERLARQIQHLLLRFGIVCSLRRRAVKYRDTRRDAWQIDITDLEALHLFLEEIGIFGKEEALDRVKQAMFDRRHQTNRDLIPLAAWEMLAEAKGAMSWSELGRRAGLADHANLHVGSRKMSRRRLLRFADVLGDGRLRELATSDVLWDEIVAIEPAGEKQVYDLTIPDTHNFVANDVCVHNTAFALNIGRHVAVDEGHPVYFVSLEMSRVELAERLLCMQARVDSHRLRKGTLNSDDMDKLIEAGGILRNAKFFIDDTPGQGMLRIAANARRLKMRHGLRLIMIDYLQLIEPDNRRDPRQEQVAAISRRLKFLARELEVPVVALAQVNRSSEDRQDHRPRLSDLRESGSIEQDADTVFLLHRPEMHEPGQHDGVVELIIGKQRNGPVGEVTLTYLKQFMLFEDFATGMPFDG